MSQDNDKLLFMASKFAKRLKYAKNNDQDSARSTINKYQ